MKKISILFFTVLLAGLFSCENEKWEFPDFDYTTVYFPYQTPVRTLVLGNYEYNTSLQDDNSLSFIISAHMGGVYENTSDQTVDFEIVPGLVNNLKTGGQDILEALPSTYYTVSPLNQFVIPKGAFYAGFKVQLTDAFLNDPNAFKNHFVLPCVITSTSLDSVLSGKPLIANPDRRIAGNWSVAPRDYTIFAVKFINEYHGKYLTRGKSVRKNASNVRMDSVVYHKTYVEQDEIWSLKTAGRNKVTLTGVVKAATGSPGALKMDLDFDANGNCVVTQNATSLFPVTGSGKFVKDGDSWGGKKRDVIYLEYQITVAPTTHIVKDTLVVRDRDARFETYVPIVTN